MYIRLSRLRVYPMAVILTVLTGSLFSPVYANQEVYEQDFVVTAYYSPLPDQCCYFRGSYEEEIAFNGQGLRGADGTGVYPGMLAGPPTYAFGTVIDLDGIGVGTVHDRGGRIIEWDTNLHRVDIWMGSGEAGLARAMEWGVRKVHGTVYPLGTKPPAESVVLEHFPSKTSSIAGLAKTDVLSLLPGLKLDDQRYGVRVLQQQLKDLGRLDATITGNYGQATKEALAGFQKDNGLPGDGTSVDERTAAALTASLQVLRGRVPDLTVGLEPGANGAQVRLVQQVMRYIGEYRGRTDGVYDDDVRLAVVKFQRDNGLIASDTADGAGRIGPKTQQAILTAWRSKQARLKTNVVLLKMKVAQRVKNDVMPSGTFAEGAKGTAVKQLQLVLGKLGFFASKEANANFGAKTKAALVTYQLDRKIVESQDAHGAGVFGPATRQALMADALDAEWRKVRASGL
ncbi:MAG TPA: peptidoglycan-binding protein [Candidatus Peribacteria bacterium]|nr:peptidoglycan-binding protein [Candidatus Peribacteria bacterium]